MKGLTRENDDVIGFVVDALYERAIDIKELNDWAINIVINNNVDELPMYIIDLMDFDSYLKDIYEVIGFVPRKLASTKSVEYLIIDKIPKVIINDNKV